MFNLPQGAELLIILLIVVLLFGVGRISKVAGEFGKGIKAFKEGIQGDEDEKTKEAKNDNPPEEK